MSKNHMSPFFFFIWSVLPRYHPLGRGNGKQLVEYVVGIVLLLNILQPAIIIAKYIPTPLIVVIVIPKVMSEHVLMRTEVIIAAISVARSRAPQGKRGVLGRGRALTRRIVLLASSLALSQLLHLAR